MYRQKSSGFLILESLLAIVIFGILIVSIFPTINFMFKRMHRTKYDAQGSLLLQEGMEVAYNVFSANSDWSLYPVGADKIYKPIRIGALETWGLELGNEGLLQTRFTREIVIVEVCRNAAGERISTPLSGLCAPGTADASGRIVRTTVTWDEPGAKPLQAELLLTKFTSS